MPTSSIVEQLIADYGPSPAVSYIAGFAAAYASQTFFDRSAGDVLSTLAADYLGSAGFIRDLETLTPDNIEAVLPTLRAEYPSGHALLAGLAAGLAATRNVTDNNRLADAFAEAARLAEQYDRS